MNYIDEVWNKLDEVEQQIMRDLQAKTPQVSLSYAVLDPQGIVHRCDLITSIIWEENNSRRIALDTFNLPDGTEVSVSTVFLCLDHGRAGEGVHFETLAYDPQTGEDIFLRAKTLDEAKATHQACCLKLKESLNEK